MIYFLIYFISIAIIWSTYRFGWVNSLKTVVNVLLPSVFIILFNLQAGKILFRNPVVGIVSILPTAIFIFRSTQPLVFKINDWIDRQSDTNIDSQDVVDAEVISKEEI